MEHPYVLCVVVIMSDVEYNQITMNGDKSKRIVVMWTDADGCKICREAMTNPIIQPCGNCGTILEIFAE